MGLELCCLLFFFFFFQAQNYLLLGHCACVPAATSVPYKVAELMRKTVQSDASARPQLSIGHPSSCPGHLGQLGTLLLYVAGEGNG